MKKLLFKKFFEKTKTRLLKSYLSVNYTSKRFELNDTDKCLCLAPHADDETIGMGGTLAKYNNNFKVICLTDGAKGFKDTNEAKAIEIRQKEFTNAMNVANIKNFDFLNIPDRAMIDNYKIFSTMDISNYDYIFLPNVIDQHKDHKAVCVHLNKLLNNKEHKKNLQIALYEVWSPLSIVNKCISIKDFIEIKKAMLNEYSSQTEQRSYIDASIGLSAYRGLAKEMGFAEAFWIMNVNEFQKLVTDIY